MWERLIGAVLLLACGGSWTRARTAEQRAEAARVAAFCDLLHIVGEQVAVYCMPLDEIAAALPPDLAQAVGLHSEGLIPTFRAAADGLRDSSAAEALARVAARLGQGEQEDQVSLCRTAACSLEACRDRLNACAARERRARGTLCLTACMLVIILLW